MKIFLLLFSNLILRLKIVQNISAWSIHSSSDHPGRISLSWDRMKRERIEKGMGALESSSHPLVWQLWVMRCYTVKQSYCKSRPNNLQQWITTPSSGDNSCHQWMFSNMDFFPNTIFNRQHHWKVNLMAQWII